MIEVLVWDIINKKEFKKTFTSPFLHDKFVTKLKYSKKLRITDTTILY